MSSKILTLTLTLALLLARCGPSDQGDNPDTQSATPAEAPALEGTAWQLVNITAIGGFVFTPENGSDYNLRFRSENRLVANSDCNRVSATWLQDGYNLTLEEFSNTSALCPPGTLHNHFISNLRDVQHFTTSDDRLIFTTGIDGVSLEFEPMVSDSAR